MNDSSKSSSSSSPSPIQSSFDDITQLLARKKNIIVLVGAGISVSCGIPDFRSNDGLYNTLNYQVGVMMLCSLELIFSCQVCKTSKLPHQILLCTGAWPNMSRGSI